MTTDTHSIKMVYEIWESGMNRFPYRLREDYQA